MNFKGAIFDMDGTILDSMMMWKTIDAAFLEKRHLKATPRFQEQVEGVGLLQAAKYVIEEFALCESVEEIIADWENMAIDFYRTEVTAKPFVKEYLQKLREDGVSIALATASPETFYVPGLKRAGLYDYFDSFTCSAEAARPKGYPDVYWLAAEKIGLVPEECVVFEDILKAVKGSKDGGFFTVAIADEAASHEREEIQALSDLYIENFAQLLQIPLFERAAASAAHA